MSDLTLRDRRQRRRILTVRNLGWTAGVIVSLFLAISLWNELHPSDDGLALLEQRKQKIEDVIVHEADPYVPPRNVREHDPAQPLWVERPTTEEMLGVDPYEHYAEQQREQIRLRTVTEPAPGVSVRGTDAPFLEQRSARGRSRVKISGAGSDVKLETKDDD